jgi:hypothetical protein
MELGSMALAIVNVPVEIASSSTAPPGGGVSITGTGGATAILAAVAVG